MQRLKATAGTVIEVCSSTNYSNILYFLMGVFESLYIITFEAGFTLACTYICMTYFYFTMCLIDFSCRYLGQVSQWAETGLKAKKAVLVVVFFFFLFALSFNTFSI